MPESQINRLPGKGHADKSKADYARDQYILSTGKCPNCGLPMRRHPSCEACGAIAGPGHDNVLSPYRGHDICNHCYAFWYTLERRIGPINWEKFLRPSPKELFGGLLNAKGKETDG